MQLIGKFVLALPTNIALFADNGKFSQKRMPATVFAVDRHFVHDRGGSSGSQEKNSARKLLMVCTICSTSKKSGRRIRSIIWLWTMYRALRVEVVLETSPFMILILA